MKKSLVLLGMALTLASSAAIANPIVAEKNEMRLEIFSVTPLCTAISKGDIEIVKKFLEYGANVNEKSNGMTPLMVAARYNNVEIMKLLIEKGANVRIETETGLNAMKYAQMSNANEAIAYLKSL